MCVRTYTWIMLVLATLGLGLGLAVALAWLALRQRRVIATLRDELSRVQAGRSFASYGTWDWAVDQDELHWSDEVYPMFGFTPGQVQPSYALFCSMVHPDDAQRVREGELVCVQGDAIHDMEYRVIHADGTIRWLRETGNVVRDADGRPVRMIGMVRDITEEKQREEHILHQAFHDSLTGLPNRVYFRILLDDALVRARRNNTPLALAYLDLDRFKPINDMLGHNVGDQVLAQLSKRLRDGLRASDHVARLGGDEFVAILECSGSPDEALAAAGKLHAIIEHPFQVDGHILQVGVSIGVALYPDHADNAETLIAHADKAMYEAKKSGDIVRFFAA